MSRSHYRTNHYLGFSLRQMWRVAGSETVMVAGHYVALVKSHENWLFFDDETVEPVPESAVRAVFGSTQEYSNHMDHGYILMYDMQDTEKPQTANDDS